MNVDDLRLHFNPDQMRVLNLAMAFLMFSVALDVRPGDFRKVVLFPKSVAVGLVVQYLLFPVLTLGIICVFQPPVSMALGMVLVSMCPSGNMTNFLVHHARANVALSVTLNAIIILSATVVTPGGFLFWSQYVPGSEELRKSFEIRFIDMALIIVELIVAPLLFGMWLNGRFSSFVARIRPWVQRIALLIFFSILLLALLGNFDNLITYLGFAFLIVAVHNAIGLSTGYWLGRAIRLPELDCRTLAFESGVHNTALGLLLIFRFFDGLGGMALIAAWWGIWDLVTGMSLAAWWKGKTSAAAEVFPHTP
ncbi:MAG TPA: bile acid:sodium symporter family protein [Saprospiraceae bacterium]|nr:bile acid:sodium symporter family protein [Saprospiraceae bacterium]HNM27918.1 bile acid:sodium symporter family protein [Saprospiraceae bacterium]